MMYVKKKVCIKYFARKQKKLHLKQDDGKTMSHTGIYTSQASAIFSDIATLNQN